MNLAQIILGGLMRVIPVHSCPAFKSRWEIVVVEYDTRCGIFDESWTDSAARRPYLSSYLPFLHF
jgi:hypothetical protein